MTFSSHVTVRTKLIIRQLTGNAYIIWDEQRTAAFAGAERLIEFSVDEVIEITGATSLRGELVEYSPFNP